MPEDAGQPVKPPRTWGPMLGWTLAILAALGLAWFAGAVAVPVWRTRSVLAEVSAGRLGREQAMGRLGPPAVAAYRLDQYLRLTRTVRPGNADPDCYYREVAVKLLGRCGRPAVAALVESTRDYNEMVSKGAWHWLETMSDQVDDQDARQAAADALEMIRKAEAEKAKAREPPK